MDSGVMRLMEMRLGPGVVNFLRSIEGDRARRKRNQCQTSYPLARRSHPANAPQLLDFVLRPYLRHFLRYCVISSLNSRSLLPVGRIDLAVAASGYTFSENAIERCAHIFLRPNCGVTIIPQNRRSCDLIVRPDGTSYQDRTKSPDTNLACLNGQDFLVLSITIPARVPFWN